jgi:two-component system CheB/CheR fusion protein
MSSVDLGPITGFPLLDHPGAVASPRLQQDLDKRLLRKGETSPGVKVMAADRRIVGIGASAGGVEALEAFFRAVPRDNGLAFVVITHLDPNRESMLAEILGRATRMPVVHAREGEPVEAEHVYVLPPGMILTIREGRLRLRPTSSIDRERTPIDLFFSSLAEDQEEHAIGIVLSGGGTDGTLGLKAIKEHGGLTIAQGSNVSRPRFSEMPASAVAAGFVDLSLPVEEIPGRLFAYARNFAAFDPERPSRALSQIYSQLRRRTGHDFSAYKDTTFQRRVQRRMQVLQTASLEEYVDRLRREPEEVSALFRDLLIGVTEFFRDAAAFRALESLVIPKLFEGKGGDHEVRVWLAGCSSGEEAYSIAILLREQMDRLQGAPRVQIFATDIDEAALSLARAARYLPHLVKGVSPQRLGRFFTPEAGSYRVAKEMRDMCIFSNHSVIRDPPFSRVDLICCRNLLIYLKPELQSRIVPLLHYATRPSGFLFLGSSENVSRHSELFVPIDRRNRIFQRREMVMRPDFALRQFLPNAGWAAPAAGPDQGLPPQRPDLLRKVANTVVAQFSPAHVIVDERGEALFFSAGTGKYLQAAAGPPTRDVVAMARPGLRVDLRAGLRMARESGQRVARDRVSVQVDGAALAINLVIEPITEGNETVYAVVFIDADTIREQVADATNDRPIGEDTAQQIEKELQETKERLNSTIEELETANEEFRSSNEELLSVNEELQSTNEELETSKEELQSVNEELHTVNNELNSKIEEVDRANSDMENLFQSSQIATIFLDRDLVIRSFTPAVTRIFNLIPSDRGRPLTDIVSRLDHQDLEPDMRAVFASGETIERSVSLVGDSTYYLARILPYRGNDQVIDGVIVTFVDVTNILAAEEQSKALAAELSHRVKNSLAVVSSIAERTLEEGEPKERFVSRLHALAQTHELLSRGQWTDASLLDLILAELSPHAVGDGTNVRVGGPPVLLKPRAALVLSMVFHELTTNAAKYGALSTAGGRVAVKWKITGDAVQCLELIWAEQGGPEIDGLPRRGFGTHLIERGIPFELQGEARLEVIDRALHCKIRVSASPANLTFAVAPSAPEPG